MYTSTKKKSKPFIPKELERILLALQEIGALPILVGGCIRDHFLDIPIKDYDIEVFRIENVEILANVLKPYGRVEQVGKSFGVMKLFTDLDTYDFALPRQEKKVAKGHQGFEVTTNSKLSFEQAAIRRDFTMNAIGYDMSEECFLDPFNGIESIEKKELSYVNDKTFSEDPLRVYRAIQFAARFEFSIDNKTLVLCKQMTAKGELEELAKERIYEEVKKFLLKAKKPSIALALMRDIGILKYFSELEALMGCEQDKEYHPEGDVWVHTLMCVDEIVKLYDEDSKNNLILILATLCHDLGKPLTTKLIDGRITSHKHEAMGVEPTRSFLEKLTNDKKLIDSVTPLVKYHLAPFQFYDQESSLKAVKRLSTKANIENLCKVALADCLGRTIADKEKCPNATSWLLEKAQELNISKEPLKPLIQGRDLITLGYKPGKYFGEILTYAFDLQIDENLGKEAIISLIKKRYSF